MVTPTALTIAGSDSSGGAGIQADVKTMTAFRVFAATAITSITAQNTLGVARSFRLPPGLVAAQIDAVMEDVGADAAKTGMLPTVGIIEAVADRLGHHAVGNLVVDPVIMATSGSRLIDEDAVAALRTTMLPLARVVTPNVPEAEALTGLQVVSETSMEDAARAIVDLGAACVLIKGGHLTGDAVDLLYDGAGFERFSEPRIPGGKVHGTGCALSAAIASGLALGWDVRESVSRAKAFVTRGIASSLDMGRGSALVNHLVRSDEEEGEGR